MRGSELRTPSWSSAVLASVALSWLVAAAGCGSRWTVAVPVAPAGPAALQYTALAMLPLEPVGGPRRRDEAAQASELVHRALQRGASFPVWGELLDAAEAADLGAPIELEGQRIDGLLRGRIRFTRRDRSTWDQSSEQSDASGGNPVFTRRMAYRLDLWIELRNLATGSVDLQQDFSEEVVYEGEEIGEEREAFLRLLAVATERLLGRLSPAQAFERRELLPWPESARSAAR